MAEQEQVHTAFDNVSNEETPGVSGDEDHRSRENDQPADGNTPTYGHGVSGDRAAQDEG